MAGRRRIGELARELQVPSSEVLAKLAEIGEYARSAASSIEAPVERKIREAFPTPTTSTSDQVRMPGSRPPVYDSPDWRREARDSVLKRMDDPFDPLYTPVRRIPRGPYHGPVPTGLKLRILDECIVPRNLMNGGRRPKGTVKYWANEVFKADEIANDWADLMLDGLSEDDMLGWMRTLSPRDKEKAAALFAEGINPDEITFDMRYDFHGAPSIVTRLSVGNITPKQAAEEIKQRRTG